jgi:hypothetical protein
MTTTKLTIKIQQETFAWIGACAKHLWSAATRRPAPGRGLMFNEILCVLSKKNPVWTVTIHFKPRLHPDRTPSSSSASSGVLCPYAKTCTSFEVRCCHGLYTYCYWSFLCFFSNDWIIFLAV